MSTKSAKVMAVQTKTADSGPNRWERIRNYIEEIKREMRLVTWPSRDQVRSTTVVVIATVFFFGVFFGVVDYVLALGQTKLYGFFSN